MPGCPRTRSDGNVGSLDAGAGFVVDPAGLDVIRYHVAGTGEDVIAITTGLRRLPEGSSSALGAAGAHQAYTNFFYAWAGALETITGGLQAAITAEDAARVAQRQLNDLAPQARVGNMDTEHLGDADKLVLAQAAVPGGPPGMNSILSETDAERAAEQLDRMSAPDRSGSTPCLMRPGPRRSGLTC